MACGRGVLEHLDPVGSWLNGLLEGSEAEEPRLKSLQSNIFRERGEQCTTPVGCQKE